MGEKKAASPASLQPVRQEYRASFEALPAMLQCRLQRVSGFFGFQNAAAKGLARRRRGANYAYIFVSLPPPLRLRLTAEICG